MIITFYVVFVYLFLRQTLGQELLTPFLTLSLDADSGCGLQSEAQNFLFLIREHVSA